MSTIDDIASDKEMLDREVCIKNALNFVPVPRTGRCYECDAEIKVGVFCDIYCSETYETRKNFNKGMR